jgi:osmotically-inducible protein OsmY
MTKLMRWLTGLAFLGLAATVLFPSGGPELIPDERIKLDVVEHLSWDTRVDASDVKVEVDRGSVTLEGTVLTNYEKQAAVDAAWSVKGVTHVEDRLRLPLDSTLTIDAALADSVETALALDPALDEPEIDVSAVDGRVILRGTVDALWKKREAEEAAAGVRGVASVVNEIAVVPTENIRDEVIAENVVEAMDRSYRVKTDNVDIKVANGVVTLTGVVEGWLAKDAAYEAAANTLGVIKVADRLLIQPPAGVVPADREIRSKVEAQLRWDDRIDASNITVEVRNGEVTLKGAVSTLRERRAAYEAARAVQGVRSVENILTVGPGVDLVESYLQEKVRNALQWNADIGEEDIEVSAEGYVVALEGTVDSLWKVEKAEELAADILGVLAVDNRIAVVPTEDILDETIAEQVTEAIDRNSAVEADNVIVQVEDGEVTLTGAVLSSFAREAALATAMGTAGVRRVVNELTVEF